jgi:hypothetical protein
MAITTKVEGARGCGYRKNGIYLVSDGPGTACMKLPIPLGVCPTCSCGIKATRGFTWINSNLFEDRKCPKPGEGVCVGCPMNWKNVRMGLIWVGGRFYDRPEKFTREANAMGVSRRISQVPKDFKLGDTWIALAHRKAISMLPPEGMGTEPLERAAVFHAFRPTRIEYVVRGDESEEEIERLEKRGFTLVKVIRDIDTTPKIFESPA